MTVSSRHGHRLAAVLPLALVLGAQAGPAAALDPERRLYEYAHRVWRFDEGLPQNSVEALAQTRDGYLWVGTQEGLARFNGTTFTVFDRAGSRVIPSNHVIALFQARDERLWIGTFDGAIFREGQRFVAPDNLAQFSGHKALAFAQTRSGAIWVGTDSGLVRLTPDGLTPYTVEHGLPSNAVRALAVDAEDGVWIGTDNGLAHHRAGRIRSFAPVPGAPREAVLTLAVAPGGGIWVGGAAGLTFWTGRRFSPPPAIAGLPHASVRALLVDRVGALWAGTSGGLARLWRERWDTFTTANGLSSNGISSLLEDQEGGLWIGTGSGGLNRLADSTVLVHRTYGGLSSDVAYVVAGDGQTGLWVGTEDGDVDHLRITDAQVTHLRTKDVMGGARVRALLPDRHGTLWIGTEAGLFRARAGRVEQVRDPALPRDSIRAIAEVRGGEIWVGTDRSGIARRSAGSWRPVGLEERLPSEEIRTIFEDRSGRLWIGTNGGLCEWSEDQARTYTVADGLAHNFVRTLYEDRDGTLWIGTYGGGLSRLRKGRLTSYSTQVGLLSDAIFSILEDDEANLWMSCNRGVFKVAKSELDEMAEGQRARLNVTVLDREDGMASAECNGGNPGAWRSADGRMWFPTLRGVVEVDPAKIRPSATVPPTVIENVLADGERLEGEREGRIPPGTRRLEFHFAAVNLRASRRIRFRYRLEGYDRAWVDTMSERVATYPQLRPGRYTFDVRACNRDGACADTGAAYSIDVQPRLHQRVWFLPAITGLGVALLAGAYRLRMRHVAERERQLQARVQEALAEIKTLSGLLPICSGCKNIRDDQGYWNELEDFLHRHAEVEFSHGLCPDCVRELYPEYADAVLSAARKGAAPPPAPSHAGGPTNAKPAPGAAGHPDVRAARARAHRRNPRRAGE